MRTSTLDEPLILIPQPLAVASSPIPSIVRPASTPSTRRSPLSSTAGSVILPIIRISRGAALVFAFLYAVRIFCTPEHTVPLTVADTLSFVSYVTYTTTALLLRVPSSLYAPDAVPSTHAKPVLSWLYTLSAAVAAASDGFSVPPYTGTILIT